MSFECFFRFWNPTKEIHARQTEASSIGRVVCLIIGLAMIALAVLNGALHWGDNNFSYVLLAGSSLPLSTSLFCRHVTRLDESKSDRINEFPGADKYDNLFTCKKAASNFYEKALRELHEGRAIFAVCPFYGARYHYLLDQQGKFMTWVEGEQVPRAFEGAKRRFSVRD